MKYDYGTLDYYDFELKKKAFTAFAVQCLMRDEADKASDESKEEDKGDD